MAGSSSLSVKFVFIFVLLQICATAESRLRSSTGTVETNLRRSEKYLEAEARALAPRSLQEDEAPTCGLAPLCGNDPQYSDISFEGISGSVTGLELPICCPVVDTVKTEDCQIFSPGEACRSIGTNSPFCDPSIITINCTKEALISADLTLRISFEESERSTCCDSCTCYGDPRCVSFSGYFESWLVCDARAPREGGVNGEHARCVISEEKCRTQRDHDMNLCQWRSLKEIDDDKWTVGLHGSRCSLNESSSELWMLMYEADSYKIEVNMGERGTIFNTKLTLGSDEYLINADDCINKGKSGSWKANGKSVTELPTYFDMIKEFDGAYDNIWRISDPVTRVSTKIRCTATYVEGKDGAPGQWGLSRLNIEEVSEPNPDGRSNVDGFCYTNDMTKRGTTSNTDLVETDQGCTRHNKHEEEVNAAREMCQSSFLQHGGLSGCYASFCSEFYFPNYDSYDSCIVGLMNDPRLGFCRAMRKTTTDIDECLGFIEDNGWSGALAKYVEMNSVNPENEACISNIEGFPKELLPCENGVLLQYLADAQDPDSWTTYAAIPSSRPPCNGRINANAIDHYELFTHAVRIHQCSKNSSCIAAEFCDPIQGVAVDISFSDASLDRPDDPCPNPPTLCGSEKITVPIPELEDETVAIDDISFGSCCPLRDTPDIIESDCDASEDFSFCRTATLESSLCEQNSVDRVCSEESLEDAILNVTVRFQEPSSRLCCLSCTCYGDPRCRSFSGFYDVWAICDAREAVSLKRQWCKIKEDVCNNIVDHAGNPCVWIEEKGNEDWKVSLKGSQCQPNPNSPPSYLLMYQADDFKLEVIQEERGVIQEVFIEMDKVNVSLHAEDCLNVNSIDDDFPWKIYSGTDFSVLSKSVKVFEDGGNDIDIIWVVEDVKTGILSRIRCTATKDGDGRGRAHINVEAVVEPNEDYKSERQNLDGFCYTNDLKKTGSHQITDDIIAGNGCQARNRDEEVLAARVICENESINANGVNGCFTTFCSRAYFPTYASEEECLKEINNEPKRGFCNAARTNPDEARECMDAIEDFGWEAGASRYLASVSDSTCVTRNQLPKSLTTCQPGIVLQYLKDERFDDTWTDYIAFPSDVRICGAMSFNKAEDSVLFTHKIRLKQCDIPSTCSANVCTTQPGFEASIMLNGIEFL